MQLILNSRCRLKGKKEPSVKKRFGISNIFQVIYKKRKLYQEPVGTLLVI